MSYLCNCKPTQEKLEKSGVCKVLSLNRKKNVVLVLQRVRDPVLRLRNSTQCNGDTTCDQRCVNFLQDTHIILRTLCAIFALDAKFG